jgi:hypothetical protein
MLSLQFGELPAFRGVVGKLIIGESGPWNDVSSHKVLILNATRVFALQVALGYFSLNKTVYPNTFSALHRAADRDDPRSVGSRNGNPFRAQRVMREAERFGEVVHDLVRPSRASAAESCDTVAMSFSHIAEKRIREAMAQGQFDNLPGAGQPLNLEEYFSTAEELRMPYSILKNANCAPAEVELLNEVSRLERAVTQAGDATARESRSTGPRGCIPGMACRVSRWRSVRKHRS